MAYINIHTHKKTENKAIQSIHLTEKTPLESQFSVGLHPWYLSAVSHTDFLMDLAKKMQHKNCVALGECGLDKNISTNFEWQKTIFEKQLMLNQKFQKPVIIHCVKAYNELIAIRKQYDFKFVLHSFNKKKELAQQLVQNGFYLSFGKALLTHKTVQESFKAVALEKCFFETDTASISIEQVYKKAAEIKQISLEELSLRINFNYKEVFECKQKNG